MIRASFLMPSTARRFHPVPQAVLAVFVAFGGLVAGCTKQTPDGGKDIAYLTAPLHNRDLPSKPGSDLLPLATGDQWQMLSVSAGKESHDTLTVVGPVTPPGGVPGVEINATRDGQPWREEFYSDAGQKGIFLTAMKDETSPLMIMSSAVPLLRYPFVEGDQWNWQGKVNVVGKGGYQASSISRVSSYETTTTPAGRFKICRVDTIFILNDGVHQIRFPSVRLFAAGVGFVGRRFADKGQPASSKLIRFNVH